MIHVGIAYTFHDQDWLGGRNYFASLFEAIEAHASADLRISLFTGRRTRTTLPRQFPWLHVFRTPALDRYHPLWWLRQVDQRARNSDRMLERILHHAGVDILSHSGYLGRDSVVPTVAWLYDFQFMHLPELWKPKHIQWAVRRYQAACDTCDGIIVSSRSALADLRTFAPQCRARAHVLPFVSNRIATSELSPHELLRSRYGLPPDFFHLPNQFWENKNHRLVIDALKLLKDAGTEAHVVCSGKTADGRQPHYFPELLEYIQRVGVADRFHILGIIPRADSLGLMRAAKAVLNPSRFEGWSTTVEEAKTLGVPLILSDIPVHREQVTTDGAFVHPDRPDALAQALKQRLQEPAPLPASPHMDHDARLRVFASAYVSILQQTLAGRETSRDPMRELASRRPSVEPSTLERSRLFIKALAWRHPSLAWLQPLRLSSSDAAGRSRLQIRELLRADFDLIVDGYPRSGNSRLACSLKLAAPHLRVRSHTHQIAHIRRAAVQLGKPTILLIRKPAEAIPACAFHQKWTISYAAKYYELFHTQALELATSGNLLVVPFELIVTKLKATVQMIADRQPSMFGPLQLPDDFEQRTDQEVRKLKWGENPLSLSLPDPRRVPWVEQMAKTYQRGSGSDIHLRVQDLYMRITSSDAVLRIPSGLEPSNDGDGPSGRGRHRA